MIDGDKTKVRLIDEITSLRNKVERLEQTEFELKTVEEELKYNINELELSEKRFSKSFNTCTVIKGISDLNTGKYIEVNQAFCDKLGFTKNEVIGKTSEEVVKLDENDKERIIAKLTKNQFIKDEETIIYDKKGNELNVLLSAEIMEVNGRKYNFTTAIDITALKRKERTMKAQYNAIPIPSYAWKKKGKELFLVDYNSAAYNFTNGIIKNILGKSVLEIYGDKHEIYDDLYSCLNGKKIIEKEMPYYFQSTNEEKILSVKYAFAEPDMVIVHTEDITKRKALEINLRQANKMEAIGTLAGGIAHDFNNILYAMIGYTDLALEDTVEGSIINDNLKEILKGEMRAKEMIQQILTFSRQSEIKKKPVKLQSIILESIKLLKHSIPATIEIVHNIDNNCGLILADSTQLHQIIMNLATNAYHAMEKNGGVLTFTLKEVKQIDDDISFKSLNATYVKLSISDTGHGIKEEIIKKIYDPYFTTKKQGKGTGMGLAMVYGIVKEYKGIIKVRSIINKGTIFDLYFPIIELKGDL